MGTLSKFFSKLWTLIAPAATEQVIETTKAKVIEPDYFDYLGKEKYVQNRYIPDEIWVQNFPGYFLRFNKDRDSYTILLVPHTYKNYI